MKYAHHMAGYSRPYPVLKRVTADRKVVSNNSWRRIIYTKRERLKAQLIFEIASSIHKLIYFEQNTRWLRLDLQVKSENGKLSKILYSYNIMQKYVQNG